MTKQQLEHAKEFIKFCRQEKVVVAKLGELEFNFSHDAFADKGDDIRDFLDEQEELTGNDIDGVDDDILYHSV